MGAALVRRGLELMAESDAPVVFVEGPPAYYSSLGFVLSIRTRFGDTMPSAYPIRSARRDAGRKLTP
jgi:predicted N-acetyltransferase YhbS